jgi:hypothetical protein
VFPGYAFFENYPPNEKGIYFEEVKNMSLVSIVSDSLGSLLSRTLPVFGKWRISM